MPCRAVPTQGSLISRGTPQPLLSPSQGEGHGRGGCRVSQRRLCPPCDVTKGALPALWYHKGGSACLVMSQSGAWPPCDVTKGGPPACPNIEGRSRTGPTDMARGNGPTLAQRLPLLMLNMLLFLTNTSRAKSFWVGDAAPRCAGGVGCCGVVWWRLWCGSCGGLWPWPVSRSRLTQLLGSCRG